jgi:hypothetical protein
MEREVKGLIQLLEEAFPCRSHLTHLYNPIYD